jgi:colanic acid biosynthesis protein WcaH
LAYEITCNGDMTLLPDVQHNDYHWFSENLLLNNEYVHKHTKWYFQKDEQADSSMTNKRIKK